VSDALHATIAATVVQTVAAFIRTESGCGSLEGRQTVYIASEDVPCVSGNIAPAAAATINDAN